MFFIISDKFVAICETNDSNVCPQLALYERKDCTKTHINIDLSEMNSNEDKHKSDLNQTINYSIICGNFSHKSDYLAVCDNRKQLIVFENIENNWKQIFKTKVARNCIKLLFSLNEKSVICGHKSGDVFEHDFTANEEERRSGRLLLGHCSMLLDLMQTNDTKYLITSDRDEKIRVSCYPNTYNIECYCLGHKEFVSSIGLINDRTLVSGSGDGSIRLWNACNGTQLDVLMCDQNETIDTNRKTGTEFPVKKLVTNRKTDSNFLSVCFHKKSIIKIYSIESLSLKLIHTLNVDEEPIDIHFDVSECPVLWVLIPRAQNPLEVYEISLENITKTNFCENLIKELNCNKSFQNNCLNANTSQELEGLYKHWFNNVETYLQNKQKRQEVMNKKKKFSHF